MHMLDTPHSGHALICLSHHALIFCLLCCCTQHPHLFWRSPTLIQTNQPGVYTPYPCPFLGSQILDHFTLVLITPDSDTGQPGTAFMPRVCWSYPNKPTLNWFTSLTLLQKCNKGSCQFTSPLSAMLTWVILYISPPLRSITCTVSGPMSIMNSSFQLYLSADLLVLIIKPI